MCRSRHQGPAPFGVARTEALLKLAADRGVTVLSNSGGPGVLCADERRSRGSTWARCPRQWSMFRASTAARGLDRQPDRPSGGCPGRPFRPRPRGGHRPRRDSVRRRTDDPCAVTVEAGPVITRLADLASKAPLPLMHSMMGTLAGRAEWLAAMERVGVPMFNDEEMAEAAGLLARYPALRKAAREGTLPTGVFHGRRHPAG